MKESKKSYKKNNYYNVKRCKQWERHKQNKTNRQVLKKNSTRHKHDAILECMKAQEGANKIKNKTEMSKEAGKWCKRRNKITMQKKKHRITLTF